MKQITKTYTVYSLSELTDKAKSKAIDNLYDINVRDEWYEGVYEDAANVGIKITGFDIGRGSYCEGNIDDPLNTAHKITQEHGQECETYKTAQAFLAERDEIVNTWTKDENGDFENEGDLDDKLDECEAEFKKSILEDYRIILRNDYEYLTSEEAIIDAIEANEYTFLADGTIKNS